MYSTEAILPDFSQEFEQHVSSTIYNSFQTLLALCKQLCPSALAAFDAMPMCNSAIRCQQPSQRYSWTLCLLAGHQRLQTCCMSMRGPQLLPSLATMIGLMVWRPTPATSSIRAGWGAGFYPRWDPTPTLPPYCFCFWCCSSSAFAAAASGACVSASHPYLCQLCLASGACKLTLAVGRL